MSAFLTPLRFEKIGAQRWLLIDDLIFESSDLKRIVLAPRGFQTDLASIPRFLWAVFPKVDKWDAAAVIHDAAYAHALADVFGNRIQLSKNEADTLFREGMKVLGVNLLVRTLMYWMVRLFGDPLDHPLAAHVPAL